MPGRNHGGQRTTRPFNWLESLDKKAPTLPRAMSWDQPYRSFMLARYPHLQPEPIPGDPRSRLMCESGGRAAARLFAKWESSIEMNEETSVCLDGLNSELRNQLAALMVEIVSELEMRTAENRSAQYRRHIIKEAKVRERGLNRRLQKARQAVRELKDYSQGEANNDDPDNSLYRAHQTLGFSYLIVANEALRALDKRPHHSAERHIEIAKESLSSEDQDQEVFGMVQLYWFFRYGCKLSGNESEVRTARLRNAFWTNYGASAVKYLTKYDQVESMGCAAVHRAVFKRDKGVQAQRNSA